MLRIGFDARYITDRYHGIGRMAFSLVQAMLAAGTDERFVLFTPSRQDRRFDLDALGASDRVELVPLPIPLLLPLDQFAWPVLVRRHRLDLVHSPYVAGPALAGVPTIVTVHDLILERFPAYAPSRLLRLGYGATAAVTLRRAAAIVAVSHATRDDLEAHYPFTRGRTHVIHNGVSPVFAADATDDAQRRATVRERYALPDRFVLAVGAGRPHKNLAVLLEAIAMDGHDGPDAVIVGTPDRRFPDDVGTAIEALGLEPRVRRVPFVAEEDMAVVYAMAEALVFPSLVEGFGLPILEAMAAGTPVIASDASVMPEVAGDAALYFAPDDPAALAAHLRDLTSRPDLASRLRAAGQARVASFTWERAARSTLGLYRDVVARG